MGHIEKQRIGNQPGALLGLGRIEELVAKKEERLPRKGPEWELYCQFMTTYEVCGGGRVLQYQRDVFFKAFYWWSKKYREGTPQKFLLDFERGAAYYRAKDWPLPKFPSLFTKKGKNDYPIHGVLSKSTLDGERAMTMDWKD